jgi:thiol-disulfide isomerase/thioredoxin/mono/diheme cytochrome c family protein
MLALALLTSLALTDTSGALHTQAEWADQKAAVFVFTMPDCPVTNSYIPELNRIAAEYGEKGVVFYAVHSDPTQPVEVVRKHIEDYSISFPVLLDPELRVSRTLGAKTTPEVAVVDARGNLLYLGRIDNRVEDFGRKRAEATQHDLRNALDEIVAGKPVSLAKTSAVGCAIPFALVSKAERAPTFAHDIAPILFANCAGCHHPGEVAPFSLLTYQDAAKRAAQIAYVTKIRYMPPWKAEQGFGHFLGERRLTDEQIALIQRWADEGAPEGDPAHTPPAPQFAHGWQGGEPDLVVRMSEAFSLPADGPDRFQCFVVPLGLTEEKYVAQMEFHPGNSKIVHHSILYLDGSGRARQRDEATPEPGYPCVGGPGFLPIGGLGGWAPGSTPTRFPEGAARPVTPETDIVVQIHYHLSGKPEEDLSSIALKFGPKPTKGFVSAIIGTTKIDIAPGDSNFKVRAELHLPMDAEAVGITPHAHYLGKDMKVSAYFPNGDVQPLIWIKDWDFNWQGQYFFTEPIKMPGGTRIEIEYTYDNSAGNPRNPSSPPRRVQFGEESTDEMAFAFVQFTLPTPEDQRPFLTSMAIELFQQGVVDGLRDAVRRQRSRARQADQLSN